LGNVQVGDPGHFNKAASRCRNVTSVQAVFRGGASGCEVPFGEANDISVRIPPIQ
jgi:hypothetical protein